VFISGVVCWWGQAHIWFVWAYLAIWIDFRRVASEGAHITRYTDYATPIESSNVQMIKLWSCISI
jgi:hypothetical protein